MKIIFVFILLLSQFGNANTLTQAAPADTTPYSANDEMYVRFTQRFPMIKIFQRAELDQNQKKGISTTLLKEIYDNYSPEFIRVAGVNTVVIHIDPLDYCKTGPPCITPGGWATPASGVLHIFAMTPVIAAFAANMPARDVCREDPACNQGLKDLAILKQTMHHELFHSLDREHDKAAWSLLSPDGWRPRPGYGVSSFDIHILGFVSTYASSQIAEDRAETFAHAITDESRSLAKAERDSHVKSKLQAIKSYLESICADNPACEIPEPFQNLNFN